MTIFMELRCESRGECRSESSGTRCWSDDNEGPQTSCLATKKGSSLGFDELVAQAKQSGWEKRSDGWVCPNCLKHEASLVEGNADAE